MISPLYFESALFVILSLAFDDPFCGILACGFIVVGTWFASFANFV